MAPRVRYPAPDLRGRYQDKNLAQNLRQNPKWRDAAKRADFEDELITRHNPIRQCSSYGGLQTVWGDNLDSVLAFSQSLASFEDESADDHEWQFEDMLGCGSFGKVGLWIRKDLQGTLLDKVAIKQTAIPTTGILKFQQDDHPVPEEALIQADLQRKGCVPVLQLRELRCIWNLKGPNVLRYYSEYCPYGDLHDLVDLYNAYNRTQPGSPQFIPEAFLWQLLHRFSQVLLAMEKMPFDHPYDVCMGPDAYVLHLDIKLVNIFVGENEDEDIVKGYPACKVADWGLARLTSKRDAGNSGDIVGHGTKSWMPAEQWSRESFGEGWTQPPPWTDPRRPRGHTYTIQHSVYQFGLVMYSLMILDTFNSTIKDLLRNADASEADV